MVEAGLGKFLAIEFCPHTPEDKCHCRKPKSLMLERILNKYNIDKSASWMIGDKDIDALCGKNVGIQSAIIGPEFKDWAQQNQFLNFENMEDFANTI